MLSRFVQKPGTITRVAVIPFVTALLPVRSSSSAWLAIQPCAFLLLGWNRKSAGQFRQWRRQREAQATQLQARRMEAVAFEAAHAEAKNKRAQWLRAWNLYMNQLLFAEAERR
jgi:hypothetical protein